MFVALTVFSLLLFTVHFQIRTPVYLFSSLEMSSIKMMLESIFAFSMLHKHYALMICIEAMSEELIKIYCILFALIFF